MSAHGLRLDEWLALLDSYSPDEIVLGLERVDAVLARLDLALPETVFHVAGTNGKGSSVVMLESVLHQSGKRVGSYTSPHIARYNERIRVDGTEATDAQIVAAFARVEAVREGEALTYFEFGTLAALVIFAESRLDVAVLEVGMGGRLDAVNAVEPSACLISNISLDHCDWLGDNIESIAAEKAGIMRSNKPVVFASPDVPQAIINTAESLSATLRIAQRDYGWSVQGDVWSWEGVEHSLRGLARPSLSGDFQVQNAAGVLALLEASGFADLLESTTVNAALRNLQLPGRLQSVGDKFVLDVAHNPAAAAALAAALQERETAGKVVVILGMLSDKDVENVVAPLQELVSAWFAVTAASPRAIQANELARRVANATNRACLIADSIQDAVEQAETITGPDDLVLVTGSFYVVAGAMAAISAIRA